MIFLLDEITKLNTESYNRKSMPYEKYFGEMPISDEDKEKRIKIARSLELVATAFFIQFPIYVENDIVDRDYFVLEVSRNYKNAIKNDIVIDKQLDAYIDRISAEIVDTTLENVDVEDENYYTSDDRAMFIAENESNAVCNYDDLSYALLIGFTKKTWVSIDDRHTRHTHIIANDQTVDVEKPFKVGNSLMMFPKDDSLGASAKEIVNCRCCVKYE